MKRGRLAASIFLVILTVAIRASASSSSALLALRVNSAEAESKTLEIETATSRARFSVSHIWVENVTGTIPIEGGTVTLPRGSDIPISVTAMLDATGVKTDSGDRDAALRSPDFFDVAKYPVWTFTSTRIVKRGADAFEMDGNLTIHGVTQPEQVEVTISGSVPNPIYRATAEIDRHAFGMAITRLDPVIGSTVSVTLEVRLTRAPT